MKNLMVLLVLGATLITSSSVFAQTCESEISTLIQKENDEFQGKIFGPNLISGDEAVNILSENNTDLTTEEIDGVTAMKNEQGVEFYTVGYGTPVGDAAELLLVVKNDCSILERLIFFEE